MTAKQTKLEDNGVEHEKTTKGNGKRPGKQMCTSQVKQQDCMHVQ